MAQNKTLYMREFRKTKKGEEAKENDRVRRRARERAWRKLAERYPDEFEEIFQAELKGHRYKK